MKPCHLCHKKIWPWEPWLWLNIKYTPPKPNPDIPEQIGMKLLGSVHVSCANKK